MLNGTIYCHARCHVRREDFFGELQAPVTESDVQVIRRFLGARRVAAGALLAVGGQGDVVELVLFEVGLL
jgi:hypothetical protein